MSKYRIIGRELRDVTPPAKKKKNSKGLPLLVLGCTMIIGKAYP